MNHLEYLRAWGRLPDFKEIFLSDGHPINSDDKKDLVSESSHPKNKRWPQNEPPAYRGKDPTFDDFLVKIDNEKYNVLDVGCGAGKYRDAINQRGIYIGMDFDPKLNPEVICDFNREQFPFPDNSFDFVFSDSVMEHIMDPLSVMDEIRRVMKPGGYGYILVPFHYKAHGSPWEFMRYSKGGVHLLLRDFTDIEIYAIGGSLSVICHILWNYARLIDRLHNIIGNFYRCVVWIVFRLLNQLDRFDSYRLFTRGHTAFFRKPLDHLK